jgi:transglutaminase-like putative cysteine protease
MQASEGITSPLNYEVTSTGVSRYVRVRRGEGWMMRPWPRWGPASTMPTSRPTSVIDPKIAEYVRDPKVSGYGPGRVPLVQLREQALPALRTKAQAEAEDRGETYVDRYDPQTQYDEEIARNIETHLRTTFTYTLDLTDAKRIEGQDPMVAFLYDLKRGHCEYFAGAMTLMCQSLGIPARMVIGFRCDDFNTLNGFYRVEQSQAHAWVEVRGGTTEAPIWVRFDPTSGREDTRQRAVTMWSRVRNVFDYLEHTWATNVIAYDRGTRDSLVQNLENHLTSTAINSSQRIGNLPDFLRAENWAISSGLITILIALAVAVMIGSIAWFAWERWRMWRRAARIGIDALPSDERLRLARQLGFYDQLLQLLERRGMARPAHLTPMEFTDSLAFLPAEVYHAIRRLTEVFYRIRYGRQQLSPGQRERLNGVISNIENILGPAQSTM